MEYTAVIRTLGKGGPKYHRLLSSLKNQTIKPSAIIVYIAEGYEIPTESIGIERYIYVKKGMLAQRALNYDEVSTEYILALDDDLELAVDSVENMITLLLENKADVISPDIFPNAHRPILGEIMMTLSGRMRARRFDRKWGYKVMMTGGYSYNKSPNSSVMESQTNAGACFLCRVEDFRRISLEHEFWADHTPYPIGEDQITYYKMYLSGFKVLTWYDHKIKHLDAGNNMTRDKENILIYSDSRFKAIFWHRFIYLPELSKIRRLWSIICILYYYIISYVISIIKLQFDVLSIKNKGVHDAITFIKSSEYKQIPKI